MIRFLKELYLTGFVIFFKLSLQKDITYKAGAAVTAIAVVEWFVLLGISGYFEMFLNRTFNFSMPVVFVAFFALFFVNGYFLFFRGHGVKFADQFDRLKKSKRILLVMSCVVLLLAAIVFIICSLKAHRRFIGAH